MQSTVAFGYPCQECGKGTVVEQVIPGYPTKIRGYPFVIKDARVGVCDRCGAEHFAVQETGRWEQLFDAEHAKHYMQPEEIRALQRALSLTMEQLAFLLGCTRQSLHNWVRPDRSKAQSRMADLLMKLVRESLVNGKIDVLPFLIQEARQFGIEIELRASRNALAKSPIILRARKVSPGILDTRLAEPLQLAADTAGEEPITILESERGDLVGKLSYDFMTASLELELKTALDFDRFDVEVRFKDGQVERAEAVEIRHQQVRLLAETKRTDEDVSEAVFIPLDK
jgi:DNA-binding transcriptional regulator YiaG